jgi:RecA/RadA recombinase
MILSTIRPVTILRAASTTIAIRRNSMPIQRRPLASQSSVPPPLRRKAMAPAIQRSPLSNSATATKSKAGNRPRLIARPLAPHVVVPVKFVGSGSFLMDRVLGGGWAIGRVSNIVGDAASGKTLLAVEACANFMPFVQTPDDIHYVETESAFDEDYGRIIGMPDGVKPVDTIDTVEGFFKDLNEFVKQRKGRKTPSLYVLDSLDALSDEDEMTREIDKGTYGQAKAKKMSELFRRTVGPIADANCHLLIVSQLRDNIGVTFGEKKKRSGGTALNFYASQIVWLREVKKLRKTVHHVERVIGTQVQARNKKCKVGGRPFCEAEVSLWFNYGIDDEGSMLDWLEGNKAAQKEEMQDIHKQVLAARRANNREWLGELNKLLREMVGTAWDSIDTELLPPMRKYA